MFHPSLPRKPLKWDQAPAAPVSPMETILPEARALGCFQCGPMWGHNFWASKNKTDQKWGYYGI